ncbi:hypothetical protein AB9Q52_000835 (plasmid) [Pantoea vagans]|uniref:hypothetical protein n=1 Tax=Pantoea vagans TaxID=470934 RepID=UPI0035197119
MLNAYNVTYQNSYISEGLTLHYGFTNPIEKLNEIAELGVGSEFAIYDHQEILRDWFPNLGFHIFLSHSHKDKNLAIFIANQLYKHYGIKTFIDSQFWGYVDKAIFSINDEKSRSLTDKKYLDYDRCMRVASNFYLILSNALTDGIDACDSVWFLNTSNSLNATKDDNKFATFSPWIFTELNFSSRVRRQGHAKRSEIFLEKAGSRAGLEANDSAIPQNISIRYQTPLEHLLDVTDSSMTLITTGQVKASNHFYHVDRAFDHLDTIYRYLR